MKESHRYGVLALTLLFSSSLAYAEPADRAKLPGRQVKVATIPIGFGGDRGQKIRLAIEHLETAGRNGVDIACLPEEFAGTNAEPIPGPTTKAIGDLAKKPTCTSFAPFASKRSTAGSITRPCSSTGEGQWRATTAKCSSSGAKG